VSEELQVILDFVGGRVDASDFATQFYANERFKVVLNDDPNLSRHTYIGQSVYDFILHHDFTDPGDILTIQGALIQYLERRGITPQVTTAYDDRYDLILAAHPSWLDVDTRFLKQHILPYAGERSGETLKHWLHAQLLERFKYVKEPPEWLQNPGWPINEHGPLVFLGQIEVTNYFHDSAAAYVFHDPVSGATETIIQVA
jgi:hypothetical protein